MSAESAKADSAMGQRPTGASAFARFALVGLAAVVVFGAAGYFPLKRWQGVEGVRSLIAACLAVWFAGCVAAVPLASALTRPGLAVPNALLLATALRFGTSLLLAGALALSGFFDRVSVVACLGVCYLWALLLETCYALREVKRYSKSA